MEHILEVTLNQATEKKTEGIAGWQKTRMVNAAVYLS